MLCLLQIMEIFTAYIIPALLSSFNIALDKRLKNCGITCRAIRQVLLSQKQPNKIVNTMKNLDGEMPNLVVIACIMIHFQQICLNLLQRSPLTDMKKARSRDRALQHHFGHLTRINLPVRLEPSAHSRAR